jgi:hypothetical protein
MNTVKRKKGTDTNRKENTNNRYAHRVEQKKQMCNKGRR